MLHNAIHSNQCGYRIIVLCSSCLFVCGFSQFPATLPAPLERFKVINIVDRIGDVASLASLATDEDRQSIVCNIMKRTFFRHRILSFQRRLALYLEVSKRRSLRAP
jgi:hypothetical protein